MNVRRGERKAQSIIAEINGFAIAACANCGLRYVPREQALLAPDYDKFYIAGAYDEHIREADKLARGGRGAVAARPA